MSKLSEAIDNEAKWTKTQNGADAFNTTGSQCLNFFATSGALRDALEVQKNQLFGAAYSENPDWAMKLLFYTRDFRENHGYGERKTFTDILHNLAKVHPESVRKNLWAIMEFGCAKDLYCLIDTPVENDMWNFMKSQFELDYQNMMEGKHISLLAKWIATPDASSDKTKALGKLTAKKLGYNYKTLRYYKQKLRKLRKYLDLPEIKMAANKWGEIEYANCASHAIMKHGSAFARHDTDRWNEYLESVNNGNTKINADVLMPVEVLVKELRSQSSDIQLCETLWKNLPNIVADNENVLVMADTSGSMTWTDGNHVPPIAVACALAIYFSERLKGDLKNRFMTFSSNPHFVHIAGGTLTDKYLQIANRTDWGGSTDLKAAFDKLLKVAINSHMESADMPKAIMVISDMQIDESVDEYDNHSGKVTFTDEIRKEYNDNGYELPQIIYWNVNASTPVFHASMNDNGVALVSGYSVNVFKQVMESIGQTPMDVMMKVINDPRYNEITA